MGAFWALNVCYVPESKWYSEKGSRLGVKRDQVLNSGSDTWMLTPKAPNPCLYFWEHLQSTYYVPGAVLSDYGNYDLIWFIIMPIL